MKRSTILIIAASALMLTLIAALVIVKLFFVGYATVPQDGMYPGIRAGDLIFFWKRPYAQASDVRRGDVVLFTRTQNGVPYSFAWRVVGLPGDEIEIDAEKVLVNGQALKRERLRQDGELIIFKETNGDAGYEVAYPVNAENKIPPASSLTVPANEFFVLGDNRFASADSTYIGTIPFESIYGKKF